ncbi:hypothetical protein KC361_g211 [Hortaea werneckii]|nr:hypothetical protein KC361_g211 [Hortaea werneckii]
MRPQVFKPIPRLPGASNTLDWVLDPRSLRGANTSSDTSILLSTLKTVKREVKCCSTCITVRHAKLPRPGESRVILGKIGYRSNLPRQEQYIPRRRHHVIFTFEVSSVKESWTRSLENLILI